MEDPRLYGHESYTDVTKELINKASQLKVGQLCHSEEFSLFRVVHALEIGSDKMDTGLLYAPLQRELDEAPSIETSEEAVEFIDALVRREMSWHSGFSLMQNVLSCVYVEELLEQIYEGSQTTPAEGQKHGKGIEDLLKSVSEIQSWGDVTKAYILAMIKTVEMCMNALQSATALCMEEDYTLGHASYAFLEQTPKDRLVAVLKRALKWVNQQGHVELKHRLELRIQFMHIIGDGVPKAPSHVTNALKSLSNIKEVPEVKMGATFSQGIQGRVTNTSPPRPLTLGSGYEGVKEIVHGYEKLMPVLEKTRSNDVLAFFLHFSGSRPKTLPIVRAALQTTIMTTATSILGKSFSDWAKQDMKEMTCGAYDRVMDSTNPQLQQAVQQFVDQAGLCLGDLFVSMCSNRSRQRQSLSHCIVSFDSLQVSAEVLEQELVTVGIHEKMTMPDGSREDALPLSSWVYLRKLNIMIWVTLLGFELDIYKLWEYPQMYYYAHYLIQAQHNHLQRTDFYLEQKRATESRNYIRYLAMESGAIELLTQASMLLFMALDKFKLLMDAPRSPATNAELMYGLRMKPFSSVGVPQMPTYDEYMKAKSRYKNAKDMAAMSKSAANQCKKVLMPIASNPEIDMLKRSAVGLGVTATMLESQHKHKRVELQRENYHPSFPVPALQSIEKLD